MKKHRNIPIFVPHEGCPNMCVFCNQKKISGHERADLSMSRAEIEEALSTLPTGERAQIAFFGGSFTGIPREQMEAYLSLAKEYIDEGRIDSIRLSTRPDYIDEKILDILARYGVRDIELGIQSMDDEVLAASGRGHSAATSENACKMITERGFSLVGQMMTGLPRSTPEKEVYTAERICDMGAVGARIYPTVVFRDTELYKMLLRGEYTPRTLEQTVSAASIVYAVFRKRGVKVIRIGLQSTELLVSGKDIASPYHEATGELVLSRYYRDEAERILALLDADGKCAEIFVPYGAVSQMTGQKRANIAYLKEKFNIKEIKVREHDNDKMDIKLKEKGELPCG